MKKKEFHNLFKNSISELSEVITMDELVNGVISKLKGGKNIKGKVKEFRAMFYDTIVEINEITTNGGIKNEINKFKKENGSNYGVLSGLTKLDKITHGFQKSDLIVIGGRPAMGKSALTETMVLNMGLTDQKVGYFSFKNESELISKRLISMVVGKFYYKYIKLKEEDFADRFNDDEYLMKNKLDLDMMFEAPIFIEDIKTTTIEELISKALLMKTNNKVDIIFIDNLQLISHDDDALSEAEKNKYIAFSLKKIARVLKIPIVVLSEVSRTLELRGGDKRPMLCDIRSNEEIEFLADSVFFIYRDEYYGINENNNEEPTNGVAELIFVKHKNGELKTTKIHFNPEIRHFSNL